jgi:hypothetical protein
LLKDWWEREDWRDIRREDPRVVQDEIVTRFKKELGYKSAKPWPIFDRESGSTIMYSMIHATDHPVAPELMSRAYERAVQPKESHEQLKLELGLEGPMGED